MEIEAYSIVVWSPGPDNSGDLVDKDSFIEAFRQKYPDLKVYEKDGKVCADVPRGHSIMGASRVKLNNEVKKTIKSIGGVVTGFPYTKKTTMKAQEDITNE